MSDEETMVERVAKALMACSEGEDGPWENDAQKRFWSHYAEAAIEAMRVNTPAMCRAGIEAIEDAEDMIKGGVVDWRSVGCWQAMIDAALKEHEGASDEH